MFGGAFQSVTQPRLEPIDRVARGDTLELSTNEPAVHVEIGLRVDGSLHRWIAMPGQFDASVQHRSVGEPTELSDLALRVLGRAGQSTVRRHVDVEDGWEFVSVPHDLVVTPRDCMRARAKGHRTMDDGPCPDTPRAEICVLKSKFQ